MVYMMNRCRFYLLLALMLLAPLSARAETSIGVVDVQALLTQSEAAKSIEKQVAEFKEKFLSEVSGEEQSLRENEKLLTEQRGTLSKDEFTTKAKEFEERLYKMRQKTQGRKRALDEAFSKANGQIRAKVYEIVQQIASARKFNLVITKQNVIVGEESIDLTDETMTRLNKELPSIAMDVKEQ